MAKANFERLLLEAVDEALASIGESPKQAIYFHLENHFDIQKQEIPGKIEAFAFGIEKIFGLGANFLESLILKRLYEKTRLTDKDSFKGLTFIEAVSAVKQALEK